jgi:hypothetical protein
VQPEQGRWQRTFTIITTQSESLIEPIHERMPVSRIGGDLPTGCPQSVSIDDCPIHRDVALSRVRGKCVGGVEVAYP